MSTVWSCLLYPMPHAILQISRRRNLTPIKRRWKFTGTAGFCILVCTLGKVCLAMLSAAMCDTVTRERRKRSLPLTVFFTAVFSPPSQIVILTSSIPISKIGTFKHIDSMVRAEQPLIASLVILLIGYSPPSIFGISIRQGRCWCS